MTLRSQTTIASSEERSSAPDRTQRPRRSLTLLGVVLAAGFVGLVILSAHNAAVPVGGAGPTNGMSMAAGSTTSIAVTMNDIDGHSVSLPGRRPGVIVFIKADGTCQSCIAASRVAAEAVRRTGGRATLTVLSLDSATSREALEGFAHSAGDPPARYVIDDRSGTLSSMMGASTLAGLVVYDARGHIVGRPAANAGQVRRALRRAGTAG